MFHSAFASHIMSSPPCIFFCFVLFCVVLSMFCYCFSFSIKICVFVVFL
jgi:hypothetical protein